MSYFSLLLFLAIFAGLSYGVGFNYGLFDEVLDPLFGFFFFVFFGGCYSCFLGCEVVFRSSFFFAGSLFAGFLKLFSLFLPFFVCFS